MTCTTWCRDSSAESYLNETWSSVGFAIMMSIPIEIVIDYNSKIFLVMGSANWYASDVI